MLHIVAFLLAAVAADPAAEVRQAETAFAKAFADRDAAKFATFVADDAKFMSAKRTLSGKAEVMAVWSESMKNPQFSWRPERVTTNAAGDLGLSTGPVFDANGKHILDYVSTWQKQKDGTWKVVFDGPGAPVCN